MAKPYYEMNKKEKAEADRKAARNSANETAGIPTPARAPRKSKARKSTR